MARDKEELDLWQRLQPFIREKVGPYWKDGEHFYCVDEECEKVVCHPYIMPSKADLRLPLPIDPADDERKKRGENPRGLWGMIEDAGRSVIEKDVDRYILNIEDDKNWYEGATPTLALLKALCEQEGL
jgi:hypothetical protein